MLSTLLVIVRKQSEPMIQSQARWCLPGIPELGRQRQVDPWDLLDSQSTLKSLGSWCSLSPRTQGERPHLKQNKQQQQKESVLGTFKALENGFNLSAACVLIL